MPAGKLPYMPFYPNDWLQEANLRVCSREAKAFWIDLLCVLWGAEDRGVCATGGKPWSDEEIAAAVSGDTSLNLRCLSELLARRVCSRSSAGAVFSRRMVRDEEDRRREAAKKEKQRASRDVPNHVPINVPALSENEIEIWSLKLYELFPRKVGRADALKAIRRALFKERPDVIQEAVQAFSEARRGQDMQFTPHPATWFNQERWRDDRASWKAMANSNGAGHSREATEAYLHAKKAVKEFGQGWAMRFKDKTIEDAIREIGGWRKFCDWPSHESAVRQREFEKAYDRLKLA